MMPTTVPQTTSHRTVLDELTASQPRLTEEQIEHYFREGYIVVPSLASIETVQAVLEDMPTPTSDQNTWQAQVFDHHDPTKDAPLHRLLIDPGIISAVTDLFGMAPRVFYGMLAIVPARGGNGLPWHQDNQYEHILPTALNVFIALCDITPDKANLWVAPRSHRLGIQPSKTNDTTAPGHREAVAAPENGRALPALRTGDVCIFDRNTLHRSLRNETDEHRYAYAAQYQPENARQATTGKKDDSKMLATELGKLWRRNNLLSPGAVSSIS